MEPEQLQKFLHDLRNPVAAILTSVEVALFDPGLPHQVRETLLTVQKEAQRLADMLKNPS